MTTQSAALDLLWDLLRIDSPSGDEAPLADWLMDWLAAKLPEARTERLGDCIMAVRGERPRVAVFAHLDTTGFTLGYQDRLIPIGGPAPEQNDTIRPCGSSYEGHRLTIDQDKEWRLSGPQTDRLGAGWVYAAEPKREGEWIISPYLDNRAGIWAALQALSRCPEMALVLTTGEEHSGQGALIGARWISERYGITQALISDITWDTEDVHCGQGVAISLRDRMTPRRRYLERVLELAEQSGIAFQREIESSGGSDGMYLQRSGYPIDWVFVGAPEKRPHSSAESLHVADLYGMADMLEVLINGLQETR